MCLDKSLFNFSKIAKRDIEVCKQLHIDNKGVISTPYRNFVVTGPNLISNPMKRFTRKVAVGIHSYGKEDYMSTTFLRTLEDFNLIMRASPRYYSDVMVMAIIPKGTRYYVGKSEFSLKHYVSEHLVLPDELFTTAKRQEEYYYDSMGLTPDAYASM